MTGNKSQFSGALFDGRSASKHPVTVSLFPGEMVLRREDGKTYSWSYSELKVSPAGGRNQPFHVNREVPETEGKRTETLVVSDPDFRETICSLANETLHPSWTKTHKVSLPLAVLGIFLALFFIYGLWQFALPVLSDKAAKKVPISWEQELGEKIVEGLFPEKESDTSPDMQKAVDGVVQRLLETTPNQPYNFSVTVVRNKTVNALALPGGKIVLFQGLLNIADTPEELAGVVAHELQHVLLRHSTRGIVRSMASSILLTLVAGDVNGMMQGVLGMAGELEGLSFSRKMEAEADSKGTEMILKAGIDPQGMLVLFEKLAAMEKQMGAGPGEKINTDEPTPKWLDYFSTHPAGRDRVNQMKKQIAKQTGTAYTPLLPGLDWKSTTHRELN